MMFSDEKFKVLGEDLRRAESGTELSDQMNDPSAPLLYTDFGNVSIDTSAGIKSRFRQHWKWALCVGTSFVLLAVMLPVMFLVVLPDIIRDECDHTDIMISESQVVNPTNEGFDSVVRLKFSKSSPIPAKIHMHDTIVSWSGEGGGKMIKLTHSGGLNVDTSVQTLSSRASIIDADTLSAFNTFCMTGAAFDWRMSGTSDVHALIDVNVDIDKTVAMHGYENFPIPAVIYDVTVTGGSTTELYSLSLTTVTSTTNIALILGQDLHCILKSRGIPIGIGTIENAALWTGAFNVTTHTTMSYSTTEQKNELMRLLGEYMMGHSNPITMENFYPTTEVSWLKAGLDSIAMETTLPGVAGALVVEITMYPKIGALVTVPFYLKLYNAIDAQSTLKNMNCEIYWEGTHIASVDETSLNVVLAPKSTTLQGPFSAKSDLKHTSTLIDLINAKFGLLDLYCTLSFDVESFNVATTYNQMQVPAYLNPT